MKRKVQLIVANKGRAPSWLLEELFGPNWEGTIEEGHLEGMHQSPEDHGGELHPRGCRAGLREGLHEAHQAGGEQGVEQEEGRLHGVQGTLGCFKL